MMNIILTWVMRAYITDHCGIVNMLLSGLHVFICAYTVFFMHIGVSRGSAAWSKICLVKLLWLENIITSIDCKVFCLR
jgi:hypothetical protein